MSGLAPGAMRVLEERQPVRSTGASHDGSQASAGRENESDNLVLGDTVEVSIGAKA